MNRPVLIYGAGFRGRMDMHILEDENIPVEAFVDRDAAHIPLYCGKAVLTFEEAVRKYKDNDFIVSIDDSQAKQLVREKLQGEKIRAYDTVNEYYTGKPDLDMDMERCGTRAAFWLLPELLKKKKNPVCFSFGIGFDDSFERELVEKYDACVYAFDPSPEVVTAMEKKTLPNTYHYYPYGLSDKDGEKTFYEPSSGQDYSEFFASWTSSSQTKMQVFRLRTLMRKLQVERLDLLKMDIEGSEFMALPDILQSGVVFDQLCIETHARIFPDSVAKMREIKRMLNAAGYRLIGNGIEEQLYWREG